MGDSEKGSTATSNTPRLEEARWLLGQGLTYGELRDEIYCQVMKQLTNNPNPCVFRLLNADLPTLTHLRVSSESTFRGWQLLCVLLVTFPPSKNFEPYLHAFLSQRTTITEGRVDVLAKHCLKRLAAIAKKGPRGKPPTLAEIDTASVRFAVVHLYAGLELREDLYRMQRSTHQRLASLSTPSSAYKSARTQRRRCQSYYRSLRMVSLPLAEQRLRVFFACRVILMPWQR
jgi:hypothetical protein